MNKLILLFLLIVIRNVFVREDDTYIAEFVMHATQESPQRYQNIELQSLYYLLDGEGSISKELHEFTSAIITNLGIVFNIKEFFGHVLQGFSSNDLIYLAEPDFFLVKTYSPDKETGLQRIVRYRFELNCEGELIIKRDL